MSCTMAERFRRHFGDGTDVNGRSVFEGAKDDYMGHGRFDVRAMPTFVLDNETGRWGVLVTFEDLSCLTDYGILSAAAAAAEGLTQRNSAHGVAAILVTRPEKQPYEGVDFSRWQ
jgi:hypothetical protein